MKPCQRIDGTWERAGGWWDRWHALLCSECRRARKADRRLARGARALREPSVPPELRGQILSRLGLPVEESSFQPRRTSPLSPSLFRLPSAPVGPVLGSGAIALLAIFA